MSTPFTLAQARDFLSAHFLSLPRRVFSPKEVNKICEDLQEAKKLGKNIKGGGFADFLVEAKILRKIWVRFPSLSFTRYVRDPHSILELALTLRPKAYLSHFTAVFLHGLTDQVPKTVYVNHEQRRSPYQSRELTQEGIDRAFRNRVRASKTIASVEDSRICLLNSMGAGDVGITTLESETLGFAARTTDLERTLIDIAIRPVYAGGVSHVLEVFQRARGELSINRLQAILRQMDYLYPYHQVIGFYLDRAGVYSDAQIDLIRQSGFKFDFYLTHQMRDPLYSERWRLFYPQGL